MKGTEAVMQMLKNAILEKGKAINQDVLLVDSFLNHQVDVPLMKAVGEEFAEYFKDRGFTRVVTIESSGIAPASFTALALGIPLVIMKKQTSRIMTGDLLQTTVRSFTKGTSYELTVKKEFLEPGEKKKVSIELDERAFSYYNVNISDWHAESGEYKIIVAASSRDSRLYDSV
jgi:xanthine phosphoribosyltransferase